MKKSAIIIAFAALFTIQAMAQSIQEGVTNLYAERYQSARSVFEKLTAANPNNTEAVYWLGQTLIAQKDVAGAKALYQKTLAANGNAPWVLVGMGQINLLEGKSADARQQFDAAIAATKGKKSNDPNILNAVGRANVQPYTDEKKLGDLDYAIARLNEAAQIAPTNPDIFVNLGNAYRKQHNGGEAVQAYRKAGNFAPALYRTAGIYTSQRNWDAVLENLNASIASDPKFAPAYENLYEYNLNEKRDFNAAKSFGQQYVSNSDPSVENDYILAQTEYVLKNYQNAVSIGNKILQQTNNNPKSPRVYRLLGYSYLELKDTAKACDYSNQFLSKATEDELIANDFILHATSCGKSDPTIIQSDIARALQMDTIRSHQLTLLSDFIKNARAQQQYNMEGTLMLMTQQLRGTQANPADLFYIGTRFYAGNDFPKADSVLSIYITAFPDTLQGYYWRGLTRARIDTTMAQGLAVPDFEKTLQLADANKDRFKNQAGQSAYVLAVYSYNVKGDKAAAQAAIARGLAIDPTNANLLNLNGQLAAATKQTTPPKTPAKTDPKPKTTTGGTKSKAK